MKLEPIKFENDELKIIDQTLLPNELKYINLTDLDSVCDAIRSLKIRGAPAIGITAAYGMYIAAKKLDTKISYEQMVKAGQKLKSTRPTAVNLSWSVDEILRQIKSLKSATMIDRIKTIAGSIHEQDYNACKKIGEHGNQLIPERAKILTHCNAGILATGGIGTALAPVYKAYETGKKIEVFVDETRPVGQGARLTYWELNYHHIPCTLITDNMAASLIAKKDIDLIIVGADRIAANGDIANKIGTYGLAVAAKYHKIPFYVAAPLTTIDMSIQSGDKIPIEIRDAQEILSFWNIRQNLNYKVYNPAFDITPHNLITAIITPVSVINNPNKKRLQNLIN
ncbi:MAG: S-methyl-5-thioribose-1-phosphate isomerase [Calditrichaceae bacterium]|nr:S-methyl-5-thioribose-1-phosphate isomerase [Calditrichaceae bacterium]